jgi:gamma-glutamylcyclotransferase
LAELNYFAYGSNMSFQRLQKRVPSARVIGVSSLIGHTLRFHKIGNDGSAKADAFYTENVSDILFGVLYSMGSSDKKWLDEAESLGNGYEEKVVTLLSDSGQSSVGFLYYATYINSALRPFSWYVHHILWGATAAGLPDGYVKKINKVQTIEDENRQRDALERSLYPR